MAKIAQNLISIKFGGTSMGSAVSMTQCAKIVKDMLHEGKTLVVTVSAVAGMTDLLLKGIDLAVTGKPRKLDNVIEQIVLRHEQIHDDLSFEMKKKELPEAIRADMNEILERLEILLRGTLLVGDISDRTRALVTSMGERLSSLLFTLVLIKIGVQAVQVDGESIIKTDDNYLEGEVNYSATATACRKVIRPLLKDGVTPVVTGFLGKDIHGGVTLLGRGGSDYTASILGIVLKADHIELRKDVTGVLSADPTVVKKAKQWPEIDMGIMSELCYSGAKIVHPKTISIALKNKIPVEIRSTFDPDAQGTKIGFKATDEVLGITANSDFTLVHIDNPNIMNQVGFIHEVTTMVESLNVPIDVCATSETSFSFSVDSKDYTPKMERTLKDFGKMTALGGLSKISITGRNLSDNCQFLSELFSLAGQHQIGLKTVSIGASGRNITLLVDNQRIEGFIQELHERLFKESAA